MSLDERINEVIEYCEWAKNTIGDGVTFNLPGELAETSRERRAHGALIDACKLIKELKRSNTELQAKLDKAVEALSNSIDVADLYYGVALSHRDSFNCYCKFCQDNKHKTKLNTARATLKELGVE